MKQSSQKSSPSQSERSLEAVTGDTERDKAVPGGSLAVPGGSLAVPGGSRVVPGGVSKSAQRANYSAGSCLNVTLCKSEVFTLQAGDLAEKDLCSLRDATSAEKNARAKTQCFAHQKCAYSSAVPWTLQLLKSLGHCLFAVKAEAK